MPGRLTTADPLQMAVHRCLVVVALVLAAGSATFLLCACGAGVEATRALAPPALAVPARATTLTHTPRPSAPRVRRLRGVSRRFASLERRSPWSLPPIVSLRANPRSRASYGWLRRRVLRSGRLALSPKARRAIRRDRVSPGALALLLTKPRTGRPLLVFSAQGSRLRVQEPTLAGTRSLLDRLSRLRERAAPRRIVLTPMRADTIYLEDAATNAMTRGEIAVRAALRWLGVPYSWGGGDAFGPTRGFCGPAGCQGLNTIGFDCSGLTLYAWAQAGVLLPHYTGSQFRAGKRITRTEDLQPGDLLFFHDDLGHMGMYVGNGQMIHAPQTGDVVRIVNLAGSRYEASFRGAVRPGA